MLHTFLILTHALCGLVALVTGILLLRSDDVRISTLFRVYIGALWLMVLLLMAVVALDWTTINFGSQLLYSALIALALYMGWRGWNALQHLRKPTGDWRVNYIDDVGFTVIALFDGFAIVSALDLGAPVWLVLVIAVLVIAVGRFGVQRAQKLALT